MHTTESDEEWDEPAGPQPYVDFAWGRTANPNTVDGELQNIAAFGAGLVRLQGPRRTAAKAVVCLILLSAFLTVAYGVVAIVATW